MEFKIAPMFHLLKIAQTVVKTREDIYAEFCNNINMLPHELETWLKTTTSQAPAESDKPELVIDKKVSRKIFKVLLKKKYMLTKGDYACMEKVSNSIQNIYQQKPQDNILQSNWRYALMNLGHDPDKVAAQ